MADDSCDAVVVQAVLEHVLDPQVVVDEINRVLKPGGLVYAETPFMQQVHAGRYDFSRYSDAGHRWLFRQFEEVDRGLSAALGDGGRDAVAVYIGNPGAHSLGPVLYGAPLIKALGTKNIFSASTVDQMPKQVAVGLMFGTAFNVPIPDIDRTDHMLLLGANPLASTGSS